MILFRILSVICLFLLAFAPLADAGNLTAFALASPGCPGSNLLKNPFFVDPPKNFSSGTLSSVAADLSLEDWSWGLRGYSWNTSTTDQYPILECAFASYGADGNYDAWLYGKDGSGRIGVVTLIQGWVWQGSSPPAHWFLFSPLPVADKTNMTVRAWIRHRGGPYPEIKDDALRNGIVDIWMRNDSSGKILMMDLVFFGNGNSWKENNTYHYAAKVADVPDETWNDVVIDVDGYIDRAMDEAAKEGMFFDKRDLKIYQVEILEELRYSWGEMWVGNFEFTYCPT